jgi:ribosomal protein S18 acetylase RimI-like enzyme
MPPDDIAIVPPGSLTIRPIEPADYAAAGALTDAAYANRHGEAYSAELRDIEGRAAVCPVLVAVEPDGTVVGAVAYVPGPDNPMSELEHEGEAGIRMLAVAPSAQGRGIGRALTVACIDRARADGRTGVALYTEPENDRAHRLYESLGFVRDPGRDWEYEPGELLVAFRLAF